MKVAALGAAWLLITAASAPEPATIPLAEHHQRLFLPVTIAGHRSEALLDSAAEATIVDIGFAKEIGLTGGTAVGIKGSGGSAGASLIANVDIRVGNTRLAPATIAVVDLGDVSRRLNGRPIAMVLGRNFFDQGRWAIDLRRATIAAAPRSRPPAGVRLPLSTRRGLETLAVQVEGHPAVPAVFDLGNGNEVLIGAAYAARIGVLRDGRQQGAHAGGGIGGAITRTSVILRWIDVGGVRFRNVNASIDPTDSAEDLNIGTSILRHFRMTVDYPQHRLWLAPARGRRGAPPRHSRS